MNGFADRVPAGMSAVVMTLSAAVLVGCVAPPAPLRVDVPFNEAEARALLLPGSNTIKGSALLRQRGGGVVTCAGSTVTLVPATNYAKRRMWVLYEDREISRGGNIENTPLSFYGATRQTLCNAQGFFSFENVADGEFFVTTRVTWMAGNSPQGGGLYRRVSVQGGQTTEVVLTAQ